MNKIIIDGNSYNYEIYHKNRKTISIKVKNGLVIVFAPILMRKKEIERLLLKHKNFIIKHYQNSIIKEEIHVGGISYTPLFLIGNPNVDLDFPYIKIYAKKALAEEYKKILYNFYKDELVKEVNKLILEAKSDFKEVIFPDIKCKYMKSMFGNYYKNKNLINISTMLIKYDYRFIKSVLYHELSHIFEFNHSKRFYDIYEAKYPNAKKIQRELKSIKYHDCL